MIEFIRSNFFPLKNTLQSNDIVKIVEKYLINSNIKKKFEIEFNRLWIHGLIHLFGHDHKKVKDFKKMHQVEKKYFKLVNG